MACADKCVARATRMRASVEQDQGRTGRRQDLGQVLGGRHDLDDALLKHAQLGGLRQRMRYGQLYQVVPCTRPPTTAAQLARKLPINITARTLSSFDGEVSSRCSFETRKRPRQRVHAHWRGER